MCVHIEMLLKKREPLSGWNHSVVESALVGAFLFEFSKRHEHFQCKQQFDPFALESKMFCFEPNVEICTSKRRIDFTFFNMLRATEIVRRWRKLDFAVRNQYSVGWANRKWKRMQQSDKTIASSRWMHCSILCFGFTRSKSTVDDNEQSNSSLLANRCSICVHIFFSCAPLINCNARIVASYLFHSISSCLNRSLNND